MFPWTSNSTCLASSPCTRLSRARSTISEVRLPPSHLSLSGLAIPIWSAGNVSLDQQLNLPRLFPMYAAFPRSKYYKRGPTSTVASVSLRFGHSIDILSPLLPNQDSGGSPRCHDASISDHAVLSDPAGVSSDHRL